MEGEGGDEVQGHNELRLRHALDPRTRRWARAEFFCSALDRPWLANNGVQQLCNHFGLKKGQLARLSRTEWTCIRRSLGRPRRLSLAFLRQVYNQSIHQYVFNVLGGNWDQTDKKVSSVNAYKQNLLPTCKAFPKETTTCIWFTIRSCAAMRSSKSHAHAQNEPLFKLPIP